MSLSNKSFDWALAWRLGRGLASKSALRELQGLARLTVGQATQDMWE